MNVNKNDFFLAAALLIVLFAFAFFVYQWLFHNFDRARVVPSASFQYRATLTCHVVYTTHHAGRGPFLPYVEKPEFTLSKLDTDSPQIGSSQEGGFQLKKVIEGKEIITLQTVPNEQYTEALTLLKDRGTFTRSIMGETGLYGNQAFPYVVAQKGRCE